MCCGETCGELISLLNLRAPVYINSEINSRVAKIMAKSVHGENFCQTFLFDLNLILGLITCCSVT